MAATASDPGIERSGGPALNRRLGQAAAITLAVGAAMGLRVLLSPWLTDAAPFITAFPAVAVVAYFAGVGPGAITALLCAFWVAMPGLAPDLEPIEGWRSVAMFLPASMIVAFFAGQGSPAETEADRLAGALGRPVAVRWLKWSMVLAAVLPTVLFALATWSMYGDEIADARVRTDRATRIGVEHATKVIETNEVIARHVLGLLGNLTLEQARAQEAMLHPQLVKITAGFEQIQSAWIVGSDGRMVASNRLFPVRTNVDFSDREGLTVHAAGVRGPYVTKPSIGRITREPFFDITNPWHGPDGRFNGAIWVSLSPVYFSEFYRRLSVAEPGLRVSLVRADGHVLARWPMPPTVNPQLPESSPLVSLMASGSIEGLIAGQSSIDGVERMGAFRRLERHPLYVIATVDRAGVLAAWHRRVALLAAFTFPTALALIYIAWVALRRTRREITALRELQHEVEQRALAEDSLRQMQKLEALGRLTGGVAHDFNNLLMVVNNNLHLMRRLDPSLADNRQLAAIGRAVTSGERLTRQLLAFARRQPLNPEILQLQERLPALLSLVSPTLGPRIESSVTVEPDTGPVEVDRAELELAIINLAINAKDAMPDGGTFKITARNAPAGTIRLTGDFVEVAVTDTGSGIDPAVIDRVFEPFFTTKPSGRGTGLGLSQVYGLGAQAGGTARIESPAGGGTRVLLYLPMAQSARPQALAPHAEVSQPLQCRVLLVEDNSDLAAVTRTLLETSGCSVEWAAGGEAARRLIDQARERFDVVVSDMAMPGAMDGLALAEHLRAVYPALPVVLMTGYAHQLHEASARRFTVLAKPCAPEVLAAAIRNALERSRTEPA
jgi:two-component system, NtrC family, sensor kinase